MPTPTTDLDHKINESSGPGHGNGNEQLGDFDREINLRAILWSGFWLVAVTLISCLLMWWLMKGFAGYDKAHEVKMMPMAARNPMPALPASMPRLQPEDPRFDRNQDMYDMRANEDKLLDRAGWVDQPGGTLRISVNDAIDAIVQRGVAPFPATGAVTAAPAPSPAVATTPAPAKKPLG